MEDKTLNLNQPLLSVRRYTPTMTSQGNAERKTDLPLAVIPRLPRYKSELKSGPVSNPGAVPFLWEQTPGKPKDEIKPKARNFDKPPIAPKLPPGRYPKTSQRDRPNVSPCTTGFKNEEINNVPRSNDSDSQGVRLPPESRIGPSVNNVENLLWSSKVEREKESSDSGDSDGAYVDALDTLSRTESFFVNCSTSGLTGLDDLDVETSGCFSTDPQVRDFMMDRFLPAAKAMTSDTLQYAPKKQPPAREQPQQVKRSINKVKPSLRYGDSFTKQYCEYHGNDADEDSGDDYDQPENFPAVCGLLPRFCLKGSLCLLNPVPAMSVRTRVPISSANKVRPRSPSTVSTETEYKSDISETKSMDKILTAELNEERSKLRNDNGQLESHGKPLFLDPPPSLIKEKEVIAIPEGKAHARINCSGLHEKGLKPFHELLAYSLKDTESGDHVVEKTLYVDTVQKVESPNLRSFSPIRQEDTKVVPDSREEDYVIVHERMHKMQTIDSSLEDFKKDIVGVEEKLLPDPHDYGDLDAFCTNNKSDKKWKVIMPNDCDQNHKLYLHSTTIENTNVTEKDATESIAKQLSSGTTLKNSHRKYSQLGVPPPLLKSPSDSWLQRTLPSMYTKNYGAANFKAPSSDIRWETVVKTKKAQQRHHWRWSEESLNPIPDA